MGDLFWNSVFGAILATALVIFGIRELGHTLVHAHIPDQPGYLIEVAGGGDQEVAPVEVVKVVSLAELLSTASASSGARVAKKCGACHTFDDGGANKVGPNLYGVIGRASASHEGFKYSSAMQAAGLTWNYETLNTFLTKPKELVPGTAMSFAGLKKENDRANLLAYLQTLSANPIAFPAFAAPVETAAVEAATIVEETGSAADGIVETASELVQTGTDAAKEGANDVLEAVSDAAGDVPVPTEVPQEVPIPQGDHE